MAQYGNATRHFTRDGPGPRGKDTALHMEKEQWREGDGLVEYTGDRDGSNGAPHGHGRGIFGATRTQYEGMWNSGRPCGIGQFTFVGGDSMKLSVERPTAPDYEDLPGLLQPGYIWPDAEARCGERKIEISNCRYICAYEGGRVCMLSEAESAREQGLPMRIETETFVDGRCCGHGRLVWVADEALGGRQQEYNGSLAGTSRLPALMHGEVSLP